jgi:hypothetical protein
VNEAQNIENSDKFGESNRIAAINDHQKPVFVVIQVGLWCIQVE